MLLQCDFGSKITYCASILELEGRPRWEHPALILKMENAPCQRVAPSPFENIKTLKNTQNWIFLLKIWLSFDYKAFNGDEIAICSTKVHIFHD